MDYHSETRQGTRWGTRKEIRWEMPMAFLRLDYRTESLKVIRMGCRWAIQTETLMATRTARRSGSLRLATQMENRWACHLGMRTDFRMATLMETLMACPLMESHLATQRVNRLDLRLGCQTVTRKVTQKVTRKACLPMETRLESRWVTQMEFLHWGWPMESHLAIPKETLTVRCLEMQTGSLRLATPMAIRLETQTAYPRLENRLGCPH